MGQKKRIILIVGGMLLIGLAVLIVYVVRGGFTAKQRYNSCAEDCRELMILNSSIPACLQKCEEIISYNPSAKESEEAAKREPATKINTSTTTTNKSTTTNTNTSTTNVSKTNLNTNTAYKDREYYCNWVWFQEIIDKDTKELIYECTNSHPWCNYADYTYENVGCCKDAEHTNCTLLPDLL